MRYNDLELDGVKRLAKDLAREAGNKHRIFGLVGPLGAGKTTFVKALAAGLGIKKAKSPTFVVVHRYDGPKKSLYHVDLYRLDKVRELAAIGLDEIMGDPNGVTCIEWVDKFPKLMKQCDVTIKFQVRPGNRRHVILTRR